MVFISYYDICQFRFADLDITLYIVLNTVCKKKLLSTQPHPADISHAQDIKTPALLRLRISFRKQHTLSLRNSLRVRQQLFIPLTNSSRHGRKSHGKVHSIYILTIVYSKNYRSGAHPVARPEGLPSGAPYL